MRHATPQSALAGLLCLLSAASAAAQEEAPSSPQTDVQVSGERVTITVDGGLPRDFELGCAPNAHAHASGMLALACGRRVRVVALRGPSDIAVVSDETLRVAVSDAYVRRGRVWLELEDGTAVALDALSGATAATAETTPARPRPATTAAVEAVSGTVTAIDLDQGRATIDIGESSGLRPGGRVAVASEGSDAVVARVVSVTTDTAVVSYGFNEHVSQGARVTPTDHDLTASRWARPTYRVSIQGNARAGLVIGDLGFNTSVDATGVVRFGRGGFARLTLRPTGISAARGTESNDPDHDRGRDFGFGGAYGMVGYDFGFGAVGAGIGFDQVWRGARRQYVSHGTWTVVQASSYRPVISMPLLARIGTEDGWHLELTTLLTIEEEAIDIRGFDARLQIPVGPVWLFAEGSGSIGAPAYHGTIGVRYRVRGNGGPGTTFLRFGAGVMGTVNNSPTAGNAPYGGDSRVGPSVQVGIETRR